MSIAKARLFKARTESPQQTEALGAKLADILLNDINIPRFVALYGDLGVGKTAFTRGIASVFSPAAAVRSPTFALVNEYKCLDKTVRFFHFDMYRITGEDDLYSTGFYDYLKLCENGLAVCVVEWSENIPYALPDSFISVSISKCDSEENTRIIEAEVCRVYS